MERTRLLFKQSEEGPEWVVVYHMSYSEFDDNFDDSETVEIILNAPEFDTAVRYAQQYLKKKQSEEPDVWSDAQILSVELY